MHWQVRHASLHTRDERRNPEWRTGRVSHPLHPLLALPTQQPKAWAWAWDWDWLWSGRHFAWNLVVAVLMVAWVCCLVYISECLIVRPYPFHSRYMRQSA